ncbi:unnamed protein product [Moneuplotes crassus]|uniref:Uncharacterized protein n=1 Tax=Euplotes crassus TaxID=5936 RepID=A0AAD1Y2H9_EUPCR|nr:unnamed protein product [Moneuplotes crassus]
MVLNILDATADTDGGFITKGDEFSSVAGNTEDPEPLFGQYNTGSVLNPSTGMISRLAICDDVSFCGYPDTLTRNTLIENSAKVRRPFILVALSILLATQCCIQQLCCL